MINRLPVFICLLLFASISTFSQQQKGTDIDGDSAYNRLGWTVSMPDAYTLGVGAPFNAGSKPNSGNVKVYRWKDTTWVQKGATIQGGSAGDASGRSISMPDSNTIAIGAHRNISDSIQAGRVRVHRWNGSSWVQKGDDILGKADNDNFGYSVSMADSNYISIGAIDNDDNGSSSGHVRNFRWNGTAWVQQGLTIEGDTAGDKSGWSVSSPDSLTIAIGSPRNDDNGNSSGHVRIYQRTGSTWIQKGLTIEGDSAGDLSGWSVNMPDKNTVAVGSVNHYVGGWRPSNVGQVRIFRWNGSAWVQKGSDINGIHKGSQFGYSVNMPNFNTVVIGAPVSSFFNPSGQVIIYQWNGNTWVQKGDVFLGQAMGDRFGYSVCMPDTKTVAISAPLNSNNGTQAGHARVFWFCNTSEIISKAVCNSFTSPSGKYTWTTSGTYYDTIPNANRCDSLITIHLTIGDSIPITISPKTCYNYSSPSGKYSWRSSGTYMDTIPGINGCDTVITIELTIFNNSTSSFSARTCDSLTSPSGKYVWTTSGTYLDTIPNSTNCDSIITVQLTVDSVDASIRKSLTQPALIANMSGVSYQWVYCDSNFIPVPGETQQTFAPSKNGNYAAIVTQNGCSDTSSCEGVFNVGINEHSIQQIKVYPNPSNGSFTVDLGENRLMATIHVNDISGKLVKELSNVIAKKVAIDLADQPNGIYFVSILIDNQLRKVKLVKQD